MASEMARRLRRKMTDDERILWSELRGRRLSGLRFRRQVPLGRYVVDFACFEHRLIVEVDGLQHGEPDQKARDDTRTAWLESRGLKVFRTWDGEIRDNLDGVLESMLGEMGLLGAPKLPLPQVVAEPMRQVISATACGPPPSAPAGHLPHKGGGEDITPIWTSSRGPRA